MKIKRRVKLEIRFGDLKPGEVFTFSPEGRQWYGLHMVTKHGKSHYGLCLKNGKLAGIGPEVTVRKINGRLEEA